MIPVILVTGARRDVVRVAPLYHAMAGMPGFAVELVHTGEPYDHALGGALFQDLHLPSPDVTLEVGPGSHALRTARLMERFEQVLQRHRPELVVVAGDVNATVACAMAVAKTSYPSGRRPVLAHVDAGLRSFDRTNPEEVNRLVTDALADLLFVSEESGLKNLQNEGVRGDKAFFVGNIVSDTLAAHVGRAEKLAAWRRFHVKPRGYALVSLGGPAHVARPIVLASIVEMLAELARDIDVIFPLDAATRSCLEDTVSTGASGLHLPEPLPYVEFLSLMKRARLVITDCSAVQEETTVLGVPCLTARCNTERPATVAHGTNTLVGDRPELILAAARRILAGDVKPAALPGLWDGRAADRIVEIVERRFAQAAGRN